MQLECAICGRGPEFPRASDCLTFPHGVYSVHRLSSWSFSSPTRCTGFANSPPVDYVLPKLSIIMVNCRHRLDFASWLVCPDFSHCTRYEFRSTLQYFCILQGQLTFRHLTAAWIQHVSRGPCFCPTDELSSLPTILSNALFRQTLWVLHFSDTQVLH